MNLKPIILKEGEISVSVEVKKELTNHVGTIHAGALYTLLETTAGGVIVASFPDISKISVLLKEGKTNYLNLGQGKLTAKSILSTSQMSKIKEDLVNKGKSSPTIVAQVLNEQGIIIAEGTFIYSLKYF